MLLRIFKTSQPLSWILILLILIVSRSVLFVLFYSNSNIQESISISNSLTQNLNQNLPVLSHILSFMVIIPAGFLFNKIAQNVNLFKGIHYLLLFFFCVFTLYDPENLVLSPTILSIPILLFSLAMILTQSKGKISLPKVYNSSFLIGLATLIYPPNILVYIILIISIFYINTVTWRSILVSIIGLVTPFLFHDATLYIFQWSGNPAIQTIQNSFLAYSAMNFGHPYSFLSLMGIIVLQFPTYFIATSKSIIKIRKSLFLMLYYLLMGVALSGFSTHTVNIFIIPISVLFTVYQLEIKKWWMGDLVFLGLITAISLNYLQL